MNKLYSTGILALMVFISGCTQHYYAPVLYKNDISYQAKPLSTDEHKSATYISGGLGVGNGVQLSDNIYMGQLHLDQAYTFDNVNLSYGVFGYAGSYENTAIQTTEKYYFNTKSFAGLGAKASANFFIPLNNADFRIIGAELSYSSEFGEYSDFRKAVKVDPNFLTNANTDLFTGALTTEVAWRGTHNPSIHYAVRGYLGTVFGNQEFGNNFTTQHQYISDKLNVGASFYLEVKNYSITIDRQNLSDFGLRVGYHF